jgi:DNA-binding IclR family transcriptional regulator
MGFVNPLESEIVRSWGFLTNHAHVLIQIARNSRSTVREIALAAGITERAAHAVLKDLREAGIVIASRNGRQNTYRVDTEALAQYPGWAASGMELPRRLIETTIHGLEHLAGQGAIGKQTSS